MKGNIESSIRDKIEKIKNKENTYEIGKVIKIREFIIEVKGLNDVEYFEEIKIGKKGIGYVTGIEENFIIVALVKELEPIIVGDEARRTYEEFSVTYSNESFGHIIDIFGEDKLINKKLQNTYPLIIERPNVRIVDRGTVERPLLTGIAAIDLMYPIGKGQRQLIIGDKKTGKTQILLDVIANQKDKNMKCIYVAIGKTKKEVKEIYYELEKHGAMNNTIILMASNDEKTPVLSLVPYVGVAIAEEYMYKGEDILVLIDDLKRHADAYREISLLVGKVPGREAYPTDIFYVHSRMLEKGCQHINGGSITILPVVETKGGDITDYISTNIISITDGQLVLSRKNFENGQKPAINFGLSVSRLGGQVQESSIKRIGTKIKRELLSYLEKKDVYSLANEDEMSLEMRNKLKKGREIMEDFKQNKYSPLTPSELINKFKKYAEEER